jgi:hypothetical protein
MLNLPLLFTQVCCLLLMTITKGARLPHKLASESLDWYSVARLLILAYDEEALLPKSKCCSISLVISFLWFGILRTLLVAISTVKAWLPVTGMPFILIKVKSSVLSLVGHPDDSS